MPRESKECGLAVTDLEFVKVATSTVCDLDFLFAFVFGDEPFKSAVAHALRKTRSERKYSEGGAWMEFELYRYVLGHRIVDDKRHAASKLAQLGCLS